MTEQSTQVNTAINQKERQKIALSYIDAKLSILPTDLISKRPRFELLPNLGTGPTWVPFQKRIVAREEGERWFSFETSMVAIIGGKVSGGLEYIDIDNHFGDASQIFEELKELIEEVYPELWSKLVIETTQRGGYHLAYRCEKPLDKYGKLAQRLNDKNIPDTLIEMKGEAGYCLVYPTPGYTLIQNDYLNLVEISEEERDTLLVACRSFNEIEEVAVNGLNTDENYNSNTFKNKPGDDFNLRGDHAGLLTDAGWKLVHRKGNKEYWRRPDKKDGISATFNFVPNKLYVFSPNAYPFEQDKAYDKFAIYTLLKHSWNFSEAGKALYKKGYGERKALKGKTAGVPSQVSNSNTNTKTQPTGKEVETITMDGQEPETKVVEEQPISLMPNSNGDLVPMFFTETYDKKKKEFVLSIDIVLFLLWIAKTLGVASFVIGKETPITIWVQIKNRIIQQIDFDFLQIEVFKELNKMKEQITPNFTKHFLINKLLNRVQYYFDPKKFKTDIFPMVTPEDLLNDNRNYSYTYYQNGVVKTDASGSQLIYYSQLPEGKYIWADAILNRDYAYRTPDQYEQSPIWTFLQYIATDKEAWDEAKEERKDENLSHDEFLDKDRLLAIIHSLGFIMHRYFDPSNPKALILTESIKGQKSDGGSGKTLTATFPSKMGRNMAKINGKDFNESNPFRFSVVKLSDNYILIDDVLSTFNFESLFSLITTGFENEQKFKTKQVLPPERSPKFVITSNSGVGKDNDSSFRRRAAQAELRATFNDEFKPNVITGGKDFFVEWTEEEWHLFDNLMLRCLQEYFSNNREISSFKSETLATRKIDDYIYDYCLLTDAKHVYKDFEIELQSPAPEIVDDSQEKKSKTVLEILAFLDKESLKMENGESFYEWTPNDMRIWRLNELRQKLEQHKMDQQNNVKKEPFDFDKWLADDPSNKEIFDSQFKIVQMVILRNPVKSIDLYNEFISYSGLNEKSMSANKFHANIESYLSTKGLKYEKTSVRVGGKPAAARKVEKMRKKHK